MGPRFLAFTVLLHAALLLTFVGAILVLRGLFLPGCHWAHVTSGATTLMFALPAGALTTLLVFQD
jgi:hypothetical protein